MKMIFRATRPFMDALRTDLVRPHRFAEERVGFITARAAAADGNLVVLAEGYYPVADEDYINDQRVGAMVGQEGFRKALDLALLKRAAIFHVHMHLFPGPLWFSRIDLDEQLRFVPDFFKVRPELPHGAIVLSPQSAAGRTWLSNNSIVKIDEFNIVGSQSQIIKSAHNGSTDFYI